MKPFDPRPGGSTSSSRAVSSPSQERARSPSADASPELTPAARILVVEDDDDIRFFLEADLRDAGYQVRVAADGAKGLELLKDDVFDVVLLDLHLPVVGGIEVLSVGRTLQTHAKFIMMTAYGSVETAIEAMRLGAYDYLSKPLSNEELLLTIQRALRESGLEKEVASLRRRTGGWRGHGIVGKSPAMRRLFDLVERVAPTRATVLITGETGTGKELVARAIHALSPRSGRPFVPVNCSALPESLLESELFGHMKGSFTGAVQTTRGLFEEANGGTLFLDEISTISPGTQVKLLRVLQERTIKRIGGREEVAVDFRLVAATNEDLDAFRARGDFREDLLYRLNVFPVHVPPLRERDGDIPLLAAHFRLKYGEENEVDPPRFTEETLGRMARHPWPGNVRELENFVERSVIMYAGEPTIPFDPTRWGNGGDRQEEEEELVEVASEEAWDLARLEREYILKILERARWRRGLAAQVLGVNRRTLYRKLKAYREQGYLADRDDLQDTGS
jgi:DNA-binding NtrC family response regulator